MRSPNPSMAPQDRAQISFRSEELILWFNKWSRRLRENGANSRCANFSLRYKVSQKLVLLQYPILTCCFLDFFPFQFILEKEIKLWSLITHKVFKIHYRKKKPILRQPVESAKSDISWNSSLIQLALWLFTNAIYMCFWPKWNLRPILGCHRRVWGPHKS